MKKVITYGTFDLLHQGHINLLRRAKALGDYLIVGVTTEEFDLARGKTNTHDSTETRIEAVRATGYADEIILEDHIGQKIEDIVRFGVDVFAIGSDWEGHFDYLKEYCSVVYLPRTEGISSTMLRDGSVMRIGLLGSGRDIVEFVAAASSNPLLRIEAAYIKDALRCRDFCSEHGIPIAASSVADLFALCDKVFISDSCESREDYDREAKHLGKSLCSKQLLV